MLSFKFFAMSSSKPSSLAMLTIQTSQEKKRKSFYEPFYLGHVTNDHLKLFLSIYVLPPMTSLQRKISCSYVRSTLFCNVKSRKGTFFFSSFI